MQNGNSRLIEKKIAEYLPQLNQKQKEAILTVVKTFAAEQQDWRNEVSEEQQTAIDKSLAELKAGKLIANDEVMKKYKK